MIHNDPRPANYKELVKKFRKVEPVLLKDDVLNGKSSIKTARTVSTGLSQYTGEWSVSTASHLLRRTLFGFKKSELEAVLGMTMSDAVDLLISTTPNPAPPVNDYNGLYQELVDEYVPLGETWVNAPRENDYEGLRINSLKGWLVGNIINQPMSLHEKMILFWHNLLVTQSWDVFTGKVSYRYFELLRQESFGNYRSLIRKLTLDPAMLLFLNGAFNNKFAPDENYGRELQELFCIGKGPNSNYTEGDVQAAARILTGWTLDWDTFGQEGQVVTYFDPELHDTSDKQFSPFYGDKTITGKTGAEGASEMDELLEMIFDNPETANYICRRVYTFFVYHEIDDFTEQNVIAPLAQVFRENNYEIMPVLMTLFKSEHFYDIEQRGATIKNPAEHVLSLWRTLAVDYLNDDIQVKLQTHINQLWYLATLGMELGDPPSVAGWPAYYQSPQFDKSWITTDTISKRAQMTDVISSYGHYINSSSYIPADLIKFAETLQNPEDPNALVREIAELIFGIEVTQDVLDSFKSILLSGQQGDYYWTLAWEDYKREPENEEYKSILETRLRSAMGPMLQLAEYQLN